VLDQVRRSDNLLEFTKVNAVRHKNLQAESNVKRVSGIPSAAAPNGPAQKDGTCENRQAVPSKSTLPNTSGGTANFEGTAPGKTQKKHRRCETNTAKRFTHTRKQKKIG